MDDTEDWAGVGAFFKLIAAKAGSASAGLVSGFWNEVLRKPVLHDRSGGSVGVNVGAGAGAAVTSLPVFFSAMLVKELERSPGCALATGMLAVTSCPVLRRELLHALSRG